MPEVIVGGGPLDGVGAGRTDLHTVSIPCLIGDCDAFFSHSWHDDAHQKLDALAVWCTDFEDAYKRSPRLWLDKVCIDQKNIQADLQCLPIFLAACNLLLIISGSTYTRRLWCCVELFVYINMRVEDDIRDVPIIITLGRNQGAHALVRKSWMLFDCAACRCAKEEDKTRMIAFIEQYPGGIRAFNNFLRSVASSVLDLPSDSSLRMSGENQDTGTSSARQIRNPLPAG